MGNGGARQIFILQMEFVVQGFELFFGNGSNCAIGSEDISDIFIEECAYFIADVMVMGTP